MNINNNLKIGNIETKYGVEGARKHFGGIENVNTVAPEMWVYEQLTWTNYAMDLSNIRAAAADRRPHVIGNILRGIGRGISTVACGGARVGADFASIAIVSIERVCSIGVGIQMITAAFGGGFPACALALRLGLISATIRGMEIAYDAAKNMVKESIISSTISSRLSALGSASNLFRNIDNANLASVQSLAKFVDTLERNVDKLEKIQDERRFSVQRSHKEAVKERYKHWQDRVFIREAREKVLERMEALGQRDSKEYNAMVKKLGRAADFELNSFGKLGTE
jgi:hypothetical protein